MSETVEDKIKAKIRVDDKIFMQGGQYIAVDPKTLEEQTDGTFVAKGKWKTVGFLWDPTIEPVLVIYDSEGKFKDYDTLP